jgi:ketosteroid isomerase-like protein
MAGYGDARHRLRRRHTGNHDADATCTGEEREGMAELDPKIQELLDKEAIREVIVSYARGVDRGDADLVTSAYHPDAVDDRGYEQYSGETIGPKMVEQMLGSMAMTSHHFTTQTIHIDGDTAGAETYTLGIHQSSFGEKPSRILSAGRYIDKLERRDGEWRIIHRSMVNDMVRTLPLEDEIDLGPWEGRRDRDDPSYDVLSD